VDQRQGIDAARIASFAGIGANPAVLVHLGMPAAFRFASAAGLCARRHQLMHDGHVGAAEPRCHRAGRRTYIGAVEIEPYALDEIGDTSFGEACVGADAADLRTTDALLDAIEKGVGRTALNLGVAVQHLGDIQFKPPFQRRKASFP
jgi:hypothetical protein